MKYHIAYKIPPNTEYPDGYSDYLESFNTPKEAQEHLHELKTGEYEYWHNEITNIYGGSVWIEDDNGNGY